MDLSDPCTKIRTPPNITNLKPKQADKTPRVQDPPPDHKRKKKGKRGIPMADDKVTISAEVANEVKGEAREDAVPLQDKVYDKKGNIKKESESEGEKVDEFV
ncbi:MAG: hypothetical protein GXP49_12485 [Deltaproteobacteria bacterium]|nr:hypothetical protein [Deltaproteobacteria bacterium]